MNVKKIIEFNNAVDNLTKNRIYEAIKFNTSLKKLFDYYDEELDKNRKRKTMKMNFENYLKLK